MGEHEALAGVRVLDLTDGFAGALATMILGDHGAAVLRPVAPALDPAADDRDEPPGMVQWRRSTAVVDVAPEDYAAFVARHLDEADIVVVSSAGRALERLGASSDVAGAEAFRVGRPRLVVGVFDAFGEHPELGRAPVNDGVVLAASGRMVENGASFRLGRPAAVGSPLPSYGASQAMVQGLVAALLVRDRIGGQVVRASLVRGLTIFDLFGPDGSQFAAARAVGPLGPTPAIGYTAARTKDGRWLQWANYAPHLLHQMLELLGLGDVVAAPGFSLAALSHEDTHALWERVLEATAQRTAAEWMQILRDTGAAGGDLVCSTVEGMDHPQVRHNGDVITVEHPDLGPVEQLGPIVQHGLPSHPGPRPWSSDAGSATATGWAGSSGRDHTRPPLDGVVLLEAATMIATPVASVLLADLGARVIKIEPLGGELGRTLPMMKTLEGKESITVDLKHPEGRAVVERLAARADIFLHNYRPGVPEKLGIDDASLRAHNPDLVYLYVGGYGKDGPAEKMPAYHPVAGAVCGNAARQAGRGARTREPADMAERKAMSWHLGVANEGHPDPVTGALGATALLLALARRARFGETAEMTTSMLCASAYLLSAEWIRYAGRPPISELDEALFGTHALDRLYPTADGWIFVGVDASDMFARLVDVLGAEAGAAAAVLRDARFATVAARRAADGELVAILTEVFATRSADDWEELLLAARVGAVRADRGTFAVFQQREQAEGRDAIAKVVHSPQRGEHRRSGAVVDMIGVGEVRGAHLPGEQTVAILTELGYPSDEIDRLVREGVVGTP